MEHYIITITKTHVDINDDRTLVIKIETTNIVDAMRIATQDVLKITEAYPEFEIIDVKVEFDFAT